MANGGPFEGGFFTTGSSLDRSTEAAISLFRPAGQKRGRIRTGTETLTYAEALQRMLSPAGQQWVARTPNEDILRAFTPRQFPGTPEAFFPFFPPMEDLLGAELAQVTGSMLAAERTGNFALQERLANKATELRTQIGGLTPGDRSSLPPPAPALGQWQNYVQSLVASTLGSALETAPLARRTAQFRPRTRWLNF